MEKVTNYRAAFANDGTPKVIEIEKRELREGELFIKIEASPVNPSDRYMVQGIYGIPSELTRTSEGLGLGFEASGVVVDAHESVQDFIGKKVALGLRAQDPNFTGVWREYTYQSAMTVIPFPDEVELETISAAFVNPLTVCSIIDIFTKNDYKAIVQNAACSSLGKMLIKY